MFFKKPQDETAAAAKNGAAGPVETAAAKPETAKPEGNAAAPAAPAPVVLDAEEAKKRAAASKRMAASFGEIALLMSRSPAEQHFALRISIGLSLLP
jgi:hypothetical protein